MLRFLIADDHEIMRHGLIQMLLEEFPQADIEDAENGEVLLTKAKLGNWDLIVSDFSMPIMNGIEALVEIKKIFPLVPVLILSMHSEEQYCINAFKAGASGYLSKSMAQSELINAIRKILAGGKYIPESLILKKVKNLNN